MSHRIVHFEIGAQDPERCAKFYTDTFGWKITGWPGEHPYWVIEVDESMNDMSRPTLNGGIFPRDKAPDSEGPSNAYICNIAVDDLDATMAQVKANGGKVGDRMPIPGVGDYAPACDTEGNRFSLLQPDMSQMQK